MNANETVGDRFQLARREITPTQAAGALAFGAAIVFALVLLQEPLVHDSMHNFRHAAGIACH